MSLQRPIDPGHESTRNLLRAVGPVVAVVGGLFMLVGFVDFFSSFGGMEPPRLFWCLFVGMPLLGLGLGMTKAGYLGRITRYMSQEITPVATDTFNYAARETRDGIRDVAQAVGEGLRGVNAAPVVARCTRCLHENEPDARFCSQCGSPLSARRVCPGCGDESDAKARFCDNCGQTLST